MDDKDKSPPKEKTISSQVLEYYRIHSQNDKLTKYFCGSYELPSCSAPHADDANLTVDEDKIDSPTSSIVLNRKLEWDYGADIGYSNCPKSLHKSTSLPLLSVMDASKDALQDSSGSNVSKAKSESTESVDVNEDVLKFLYEKLGIPIAESTPFPKSILKKTEHLTQDITDYIKKSEEDNLKCREENANLKKESFGQNVDTQTEDLNTKPGTSNQEDVEVNLGREISTQTANINPGHFISKSSKLTKDDLKKIKKLLNECKNKSSKSLDNEIKTNIELEPYDNRNLHKISSSSSSISSPKDFQKISSTESSSYDKRDQIKVTSSSSSNLETSLKYTASSLSSNEASIKEKQYANFLKDLSNGSKSTNEAKNVDQLARKNNGTKKEVNLNMSSFYFEVKAGENNDNKPKIVKFQSTSLPCLSSTTILVNIPKSGLRKLHITKPVSVECIQNNYKVDKITQTTSKHISVGVQTTKHKKYTDNSKVFYLKYKDKSNSSSSSNSELKISNSNSFEFLYNPLENKENINQPLNTLKRSSLKEDLSVLSDKSSRSEDQNYLSNLLHKPPIEVEEKLKLLQKLFKSKNYNEETKKHYLKKFLKDILRSNCDDSSDLSEKITPKLEPKLPSKKFVAEHLIDDKLQGNVPWVPIRNMPKMFDDFNLDTDENLLPKSRGSTDEELRNLNYAQKSGNRGVVLENIKSPDSRDKDFVNDFESKPSGSDDRLKYLYNKVSSREDSGNTKNSETGSSNIEKSNSLDLRNKSKNGQDIYEIDNSCGAHKKSGKPKVDRKLQSDYDYDSNRPRRNSKLETNKSQDEDEEWHHYKDDPLKFDNFSTQQSRSDHSSNDQSKTDRTARSWRDDKTITEKIHDNKIYKCKALNCNDDLVTYAKKERNHQLSWINNEINHLEKLKNLLLMKNKSATPTSSESGKDVSDKRTAIYMITTERVKGKDPKEKPDINVRVHDKIGNKDYKVTEIITTIPDNTSKRTIELPKSAADKPNHKEPEKIIAVQKANKEIDLSKAKNDLPNLSDDSYTTVSDYNEVDVESDKKKKCSKLECTKQKSCIKTCNKYRDEDYYEKNRLILHKEPIYPKTLPTSKKSDFLEKLEELSNEREVPKKSDLFEQFDELSTDCQLHKNRKTPISTKSNLFEKFDKLSTDCQLHKNRKTSISPKSDLFEKFEKVSDEREVQRKHTNAKSDLINKFDMVSTECKVHKNQKISTSTQSDHLEELSKQDECTQSCRQSMCKHCSSTYKGNNEQNKHVRCTCLSPGYLYRCTCYPNQAVYHRNRSASPPNYIYANNPPPTCTCNINSRSRSHSPEGSFTQSKKPEIYNSREYLNSPSRSVTPHLAESSLIIKKNNTPKKTKTTFKKKTILQGSRAKFAQKKSSGGTQSSDKTKHAGPCKSKVCPCGNHQVFTMELQNAVLVSNAFGSSSINPGNCVQRLVIEVPLNSNMPGRNMPQTDRDEEKSSNNGKADLKNIKSVAYSLSFQRADSKGRISKQKYKITKEVTKNTQQEKQLINDTNDFVKETSHEGNKRDMREINKTLQEYLSINNPNFIKAANERRKQMSELAQMRERKGRRSIYERTKLGEKARKYNRKKLFTSREMKTMATRKYKKLPEVQQKVYENRKRQFYETNRHLATLFKQKLKENVLKGKTDLSTSVSVINMEIK